MDRTRTDISRFCRPAHEPFCYHPLAEGEGLEPPIDRIKTCCLTIWPSPNCLAEGGGVEPLPFPASPAFKAGWQPTRRRLPKFGGEQRNRNVTYYDRLA